TVNSANEPPHLESVGDKVAVIGQPLTFTLRAHDLDQDPLTFSAQGLPGDAKLTPGPAYGTATVTWTPTAAAPGTYSVTFAVADDGNGHAAPVSIDRQTIRLVARAANRAPLFAPVGDQVVSEGQALAVHLVATDPDGDGLTFSAANLPAGATLDPITGTLR